MLLLYLIEPIYISNLIIGSDPGNNTNNDTNDCNNNNNNNCNNNNNSNISQSISLSSQLSSLNRAIKSRLLKENQLIKQNNLEKSNKLIDNLNYEDNITKLSLNIYKIPNLQSLQGIGKSISEFKNKLTSVSSNCNNKLKPCGTCINWIRIVENSSNNNNNNNKTNNKKSLTIISNGSIEVILSSSGSLQGCTKHNIGHVETSSRLCRRELSMLFSSIISNISTLPLNKVVNKSICHSLLNHFNEGDNIKELIKKPYSWWKNSNILYNDRKLKFLSISPFNQWLCDNGQSFPLNGSIIDNIDDDDNNNNNNNNNDLNRIIDISSESDVSLRNKQGNKRYLELSNSKNKK
jgi:hypothetical protein